MNLADAIRKATQASGVSLGQPETPQATPRPAQEAAQQPAPVPTQAVAPAVQPVVVQIPEAAKEQTLAKEQDMKHPSEADTPPGHNVVRLELVLNPEQLKHFFGAVIASQHTVLTLREASSFLRVSQGSLERLAEEGDVPGMLVDGKWRFTRQALEDWLYTHPKKKEA